MPENEKYYNKFIHVDEDGNETVLLDLNSLTVTATDIRSGVKAVDKTGRFILGSLETYQGETENPNQENSNEGLPVELNSVEEINNFATKKNVGKVFKFVGNNSGEYVKNALYIVSTSEE